MYPTSAHPNETDVRVVQGYIDYTVEQHVNVLHEAERYMQERPDLDWHVQKENLLRAHRV